MNRVTGLVSPQFHFTFDNKFSTIRDDRFDLTWQLKSGLILQCTLKRRSDHLRSTPSKTKRGTKSEAFGHTSSRGRNDDTTNVEIPTDMGKDDEERAMRLQRRNVRKQIINNDQREIIGNQREVENDAHPEGGVKEIPKSNIIADETTMNPSEIFCYEAMYPEADADIHDPLLAYKAVSDPDTMYLHQAMKKDDRNDFIKTIQGSGWSWISFLMALMNSFLPSTFKS